MRGCILCLIWLVLTGVNLRQNCRAEDRLWVEAKINNQPVKLFLDTGASGAILWAKSAERLGLKVTAPNTNSELAAGKVFIGRAERCVLNVWKTNVPVQFAVTEAPSYLELNFDGVLGWANVTNNIIEIDAVRHKLKSLAKLPRKLKNWTQLKLHDSDILYLELPRENRPAQIVEVDTGDEVGVALNSQSWHEWKLAHPKQPLTLHSFFMPASGLVTREEAWSDSLNLGPIQFYGVPVTEASPTQIALGSTHFAASLGMAALKRLDLVVDAKNGMAYVRAKTSRPPPYEHNRAGADFVPPSNNPNILVAQVVNGGPAYEAGLRDGDILLHVSSFQPSGKNRKLDRGESPARQPAGTRLTALFKRGNETNTVTVTLREIVAPGVAKP